MLGVLQTAHGSGAMEVEVKRIRACCRAGRPAGGSAGTRAGALGRRGLGGQGSGIRGQGSIQKGVSGSSLAGRSGRQQRKALAAARLENTVRGGGFSGRPAVYGDAVNCRSAGRERQRSCGGIHGRYRGFGGRNSSGKIGQLSGQPNPRDEIGNRLDHRFEHGDCLGDRGNDHLHHVRSHAVSRTRDWSGDGGYRSCRSHLADDGCRRNEIIGKSGNLRNHWLQQPGSSRQCIHGTGRGRTGNVLGQGRNRAGGAAQEG